MGQNSEPQMPQSGEMPRAHIGTRGSRPPEPQAKGPIMQGAGSQGPVTQGVGPQGPITREQRIRRSPVRSRRRTRVLWWIALSTGVFLSAFLHIVQFSRLPFMDATASQQVLVSVIVDLALGLLALGLLPAALHHDPMEVQESYVGPPSALVASLVILCVWMVSYLAAPAGAIVLISVCARLSLGWTLPAIGASMLSIIVYELTFDIEFPGVRALSVFAVLVLTLTLVAMGSARGLVLRRLL